MHDIDVISAGDADEVMRPVNYGQPLPIGASSMLLRVPAADASVNDCLWPGAQDKPPIEVAQVGPVMRAQRLPPPVVPCEH